MEECDSARVVLCALVRGRELGSGVEGDGLLRERSGRRDEEDRELANRVGPQEYEKNFLQRSKRIIPPCAGADTAHERDRRSSCRRVALSKLRFFTEQSPMH